MTFDFDQPGAELAVAGVLLARKLPFTALQVRSDGVLLVGCEGHKSDVARMRSEARGAAKEFWSHERPALDGEAEVEAAWLDFMRAPFGDRTATFRIVTTPSRIAADVERAARTARSMRFATKWSADAACGTAELSVDCEDRSDEIVELEQALTESTTLRVTRCPLALRSSLILHGRPPAGAPLMRLLKSQFDPTGTLSGAPFADGTHGDG